MFEMIKKQLMLRYDEIILVFVAAAGFYIFGIGVMAVIARTNSEEDIFLVGTLLFITMLVMLLLVVQCTALSIHFNHAVSMGRTRKSFFWSYLSISFLMNVLSGFLVCLLGLAEKAFYGLIFPGKVLDTRVLDFIKIEYVAAAVVAITIIGLFLGILVLKFGYKIFWGIWVLWMIGCYAPLALSKEGSTEPSFLEKMMAPVTAVLSHITEQQWIVFAVILLIAAFMTSILLIRKQQVKL